MSPANLKFLTVLEQVIGDRLKNGSEKSYTASLAAQGPTRVAQKIGEEGVELALASVIGTREDILCEASDLIYHLLVLLKTHELGFADVVAELEARHVESQPPD